MRRLLGGIAAALALIAGTVLAVTPAYAATQTVSDTPAGPVQVGSGSPSEVLRTFAVAEPGVVTNVTIMTDVLYHDEQDCAVPPGTSSMFPSELGMALISPSGTRVELTVSHYEGTPTYGVGPPAGRYQVTFDDTATDLVGTTNGQLPETGTFRPTQALSTFDGEVAAGTWTLRLHDDSFFDASCYYGAALTVETDMTASSTMVTVSPNPIIAGEEVILTATVIGAAPTGAVEFFSGPLSLGTAPLVNGVATLAVTGLPAGSYEITAAYSGDGGNTGSATLAPVTLTVNPAPAPVTPTPPARVETAA